MIINGYVLIQLQLIISPELAHETVCGGEDGWCEALWTILDNARTAGDPIIIQAQVKEQMVSIQISDNGPPVSPENLTKAGQPFFTAWPTERGTGLGLYVARSYATAVGGELRLEARPQGVCATLLLPLEHA